MESEAFVAKLKSFFPFRAFAQEEDRDGAEGLWTLKSPDAGEWGLYLRSDLDLDSDGGDAPGIAWDATHQDDTSLHWPDGKPVDSNSIPFVVIPGGWNRGIKLGDMCHVQYANKVVAAIVADIGPQRKIGEGSIALHRLLGFERVRNGRIVDIGIDKGVRTVFYPGSGNGFCQTVDKINEAAESAWSKLSGEV
jgi:Fungal chitosanase of glycosyl hydrolase group 75